MDGETCGCGVLGRNGKDGEAFGKDGEKVDGKVSCWDVVEVLGCSVVVATEVEGCEG